MSGTAIDSEASPALKNVIIEAIKNTPFFDPIKDDYRYSNGVPMDEEWSYYDYWRTLSRQSRYVSYTLYLYFLLNHKLLIVVY